LGTVGSEILPTGPLAYAGMVGKIAMAGLRERVRSFRDFAHPTARA
jgi:hypothetical protein